MAKHARSEGSLGEWPTERVEEVVERKAERESAVRTEEVKEELPAVGTTIEAAIEEEAQPAIQLATTNVAAHADLGDGSFWSLLFHAGYTRW